MTELAAGKQVQPLLRIFEKQLLQSAGFGMQLDHEHDTDRVISSDAWYLYKPEAGPVRCDRGQGQDAQLVSGSALLALKSGQIKGSSPERVETAHAVSDSQPPGR